MTTSQPYIHDVMIRIGKLQAIIADCAARGEVCPANEKLADMLGSTRYSIKGDFRRLRDLGRVKTTGIAMMRIATIVETGARTADPKKHPEFSERIRKLSSDGATARWGNNPKPDKNRPKTPRKPRTKWKWNALKNLTSTAPTDEELYGDLAPAVRLLRRDGHSVTMAGAGKWHFNRQILTGPQLKAKAELVKRVYAYQRERLFAGAAA